MPEPLDPRHPQEPDLEEERGPWAESAERRRERLAGWRASAKATGQEPFADLLQAAVEVLVARDADEWSEALVELQEAAARILGFVDDEDYPFVGEKSAAMNAGLA